MSDDIGEDILKAIRFGMAQEVSGKGKIAKIIAKAENGKANFNDVSELSTQLGNALSRLIAANVTPDKLPNGRLYYNIANTFLTGSLKDNYDLINVTAQAVQESVDNKKSIKIEPQKADFPAERVHNIVNAVSDETVDWSTIERRLDSPIRNVTESFYNDYVEANAEFRSDAGLKSYIVRETDGNCCTWCSSLAGQYEYPNDVPPDVYARHDNCTCTVTYVTDKYRQDVWSKKSYALTPEERKNVLENTPKPERFTRQQAKAVEKSNLKGAVGVANSGESGIIKATNNTPSFKNPEQAKEYIKSDKQPKTIFMGSQKKHIEGTKEYNDYVNKLKSKGKFGPSRLTVSVDEAQEIVDKYHGTGEIKLNKKGEIVSEKIKTDKVLGVSVNDLSGIEVYTDTVLVKYARKGTHIIPTYPLKGE